MSNYGDYATKILYDEKARELRASAARDHLAREAGKARQTAGRSGARHGRHAFAGRTKAA